MGEIRWRKCDISTKPCYIDLSIDECYYLREYVGIGYTGSDSNQLIINFKIPIKDRETHRWYYKKKAIEKFAAELNRLLAGSVCIIPMPTSCPKSDPQYDSRLVDTIRELQKYKPGIRCEDIIETRVKIPSASKDGGPRDPKILATYYCLRKPENALPSIVVLLDDVITTGGHFKACKSLLRMAHPNVNFIGVFWARRVFDDLGDFSA